MTITAEQLQGISPQQVSAWLRAQGWVLGPRRGDTVTYTIPGGEEGGFEVELPLQVGFRDYLRRLAELVDILTVVSGRPAPWIVAELRASTFDIIRFRSTGPGVGGGRVPIELSTRLFANARDLVLAAACSASDPRAAYRTRKPTEATEFLRRVKVATPEEGSFIITVHAPVPPGLQAPLLEGLDATPYERRSTLMLATAATAARAAAERAGLSGDASPLLQAEAQGISANLCEALAGFVDGEETTGLDLQFGWAASRLVPGGTPMKVRFTSDLSPILREGARLLRASVSVPEYELSGAVVKLESNQPEQGGVAVIAGAVDGHARRVRVTLGPAEYARAIEAHAQREWVRCEGDLAREGHRFHLNRVRLFVLVTGDE